MHSYISMLYLKRGHEDMQLEKKKQIAERSKGDRKAEREEGEKKDKAEGM